MSLFLLRSLDRCHSFERMSLPQAFLVVVEVVVVVPCGCGFLVVVVVPC